jgi:RNA polymerase sigma factor (sigma-70 family)
MTPQQPLTCADFACLYRAHFAMVKRRAKQLLGCEHLAGDVAQDVFIKFLKYLSKEPDVKNVAGLLYKMAGHSALEKLQEQKRLCLTDDDDRVPDSAPLAHGDHVDLVRVLGQVEPEEALVACYYFVDGHSQEHIAVKLGISRRTVERRLESFTENAQRLVAPVAARQALASIA